MSEPARDRGRRAHRREIGLTVLFFALFLAAGHTGIWFVIFGVDGEARLLGFPAHYAVALLAGWPVLLALAVAYAWMANRLDDEIAASGGPGNEGAWDGAERASGAGGGVTNPSGAGGGGGHASEAGPGTGNPSGPDGGR